MARFQRMQRKATERGEADGGDKAKMEQAVRRLAAAPHPCAIGAATAEAIHPGQTTEQPQSNVRATTEQPQSSERETEASSLSDRRRSSSCAT